MEAEYTLMWPELKESIDVVVTHNPENVNKWIINANAYLSLPTVRLKIVYLAVLPGRGSTRMPDVLQLFVGRSFLFFQLAHAPPRMPLQLKMFLANRNHLFFGGYMEFALLRLDVYYAIRTNMARRLDQRNCFIMHPEVPGIHWTVTRPSDNYLLLCCYDAFANYQIFMAMYELAICGVLWFVLAEVLLVVLAAIARSG